MVQSDSPTSLPDDITFKPPYTVAGKTISDTTNPYEAHFGYHRAVRKGPFIFVAGTTAALPSGKVEAAGDAGAQARFAMGITLRAVEELGGCKADICRVRMYVAVGLVPFSPDIDLSPPCEEVSLVG